MSTEKFVNRSAVRSWWPLVSLNRSAAIGYPGLGPRNEAAYVTAVQAVRFAEPPLEERLFEKRNVHGIQAQKEQRPPRVRPRDENERFAEQDEEDPRDHGVAHVAIRTVDDERLWRVPGGKRPPALYRKMPKRPANRREPMASAATPAI